MARKNVNADVGKSNGVSCCRDCTERWVKDGNRCHSTCEKYAAAKKEYKAKEKWLKQQREKQLSDYDFNKVTIVSK